MAGVYDTPIDHYCDAWEADDSIIPTNLVLPPSNGDHGSYFYVKIVAEFSTHVVKEEDESTLVIPTNTLKTVQRVRAFLEPLERLVHEDTSGPAVSSMLSAVDVPSVDVQPFMVQRIGERARSMARAAHNAGRRVLPMIVSIYVEDYVEDYYSDEEEDGDAAVSREEAVES